MTSTPHGVYHDEGLGSDPNTPLYTPEPGQSRAFLGANDPAEITRQSYLTGEDGIQTPSASYGPAPLDSDIEPPRSSVLSPDADIPRASYGFVPSAQNSAPLLDQYEKPEDVSVAGVDSHNSRRRALWKRPVFWLLALVALIIVVLAVILPVYFKVIKPNNKNDAATGSGSGPNPESPTGATSGGNGSVVVTTNGSFTYINPYGGYWVYDAANPFNDSAQPNSWTPPLSEQWDFSQDKIWGVNLGGWLVLEPFIVPQLFQKYPTAVDEWTLSELMANDTSPGGGLQQIEEHYATFITEEDFAQIAGAGLNWVRLPIPFWAIDTWEGEPFLAKVSWKYALKAFEWARKYGLRIYLDLHTCPGSQNGYNHSGRLGEVNFLNGIMGMANAQRMMDYIRIISEFISQPEYVNVIPIFGIINEPLLTTIGQTALDAFYVEAYNMIRGITGFGAGNGFYMTIHDGFMGVGYWADWLPGIDRVILDTHTYFAFDNQPNDSPIVTDDGNGQPGGVWPKQACSAWGPSMNTSQSAFGVTLAGEFSTGYNDCGLWVRGVNISADYGGNCSLWQDASTWNSTVVEGLLDFTLASMDALQNYFFWTWKIGNSTAGYVEAPLWSYQLGLQYGYVPSDPRTAVGTCANLDVDGDQFNGSYASWATGGAGANSFTAGETQAYPWPPVTLNNVPDGAAVTQLPSYVETGSVVTLPTPTFTGVPASVSQGDGWYDSSDTTAGVTAIQGCSYPDAWSALNLPLPTLCGAASTAAATATTTPALTARYVRY